MINAILKENSKTDINKMAATIPSKLSMK